MTTSTIQTPATWDTGAVAKPGPMMVVNPERQIADEQHDGISTTTGLNGPFVADLLAACATHGRCGVNLFKTLEARTNNPMAKTRFRDFQEDALEAVHIWEDLAAIMGVPIVYASPPARLTEAMDTKMVEAFLLTGSADQATVELKGIEAVMLAATTCVADAGLLAALADGLDDSAVSTTMRESAADLMATAETHLEWAVKTQHQMVLTQANSKMAEKAVTAAEALVGKVRDVLGR